MMGRGFDWSCPMCGYGSATGAGWLDALLFWLFVLAILAGLVLLVVWIVRQTSSGHADRQGPQDTDDALLIARARYARGEITHDEYEAIVRTLTG
jgi:putative membrane protein